MAKSFLKDPSRRNDPPMSILAHLCALRKALVFAVLSWTICVIFAMAFAPKILSWLKNPADSSEMLVCALDLTSGFSSMMSIAVWGGSVLAFPFIAFAVLRFVFPALTSKEKFILLSVLVSGSALFIIGVALAYAKTLPLVVGAFREMNEWMGLGTSEIRIEGYIAIVMKTIIAFGLVFQLPLVIFVLGWFGVVTSASLKSKRRAAIVVSFIAAMFLTPPDPMSQIFMAIPLCLLYELSIWAVWLRERSLGDRTGL